MRSLFAALVIISAAACAPGAPGAASSGPTRVIETGDGMYVELASEGRGASARFSATPEQVWAALPGAYAELGIEPGTIDQTSWTFGNRQVRASRRFAGVPMTNLFRCGNTSAGAPAAGAYRIQMSVLTQLIPVAAGGTEAVTTVGAAGTSTEGTSTAAVACSSTGALEQRIADEIRARVGG